MLEIIATTAEEAVIAEQGGADRIELIAAFEEGGLTPGMETVKSVLESVRIPVRVMIRPHSRGFVYSPEDIRMMCRDIRSVREAGGNGIVTGLLDKEGGIDRTGLEMLLAAADGMKVTFHRAFDQAADQFKALEVLSGYPQITDVLTSGGQETAPQGIDRLRQLRAAAAGGGPGILAGSGLTVSNIGAFITRTGIERLHFGSAVRIGGDPLAAIDPARLAAVRGQVSRCLQGEISEESN